MNALAIFAKGLANSLDPCCPRGFQAAHLSIGGAVGRLGQGCSSASLAISWHTISGAHWSFAPVSSNGPSLMSS